MRRVTLNFVRQKGGPGDKIMFRPPPMSRTTDPYRQDSLPPHRIAKTLAKTGIDKEFIEYQVKQFELGKRHLGNMMGVDSELMTQSDINQAIQYLFPIALFSKRSRPIMKHPDEIFPKTATLEVDENKRPKNPFFFSVNAEFSNLFFLLADAIHKCDQALKEGRRPERFLPYDPLTQRWMGEQKLSDLLNTKVAKYNMRHFNSLIRRLATHPMAADYEHLLEAFRVKTGTAGLSIEVKQQKQSLNDIEGFLESDPFDRVSIAQGAKFTAKATVELRPCKDNEEAEVTVNEKLLSEHFDYIQDREQVMFPISVTKMYGKFHVKATVEGGGRSSQSNSVRLALSRAMVPFLEDNLVEKLRLSGMLTRDPRKRERNKIAQPGPRKKKQFRKR